MADCSTLADVRVQIDRLDRRIVSLIAERAGYVEQAARLKKEKAQVIDLGRIEEIIGKVRHLANENGTSPELVENIYRAMIDAFIMHESHEWTRLHSEP